MRHLCLLGLTLTLASCSPRSPEGLAQSFCKELSAGRWEKALKVIGRDTQVSSSLAAAPADERQITEAMLGSSRCQVTAFQDQTAEVTFDAVDAPAIMRGLVGQSLGALFGGTAPDAQNVVAQFNSKDAPRKTLVKIVPFVEKDGRWAVSDFGLGNLADGMTGGMGGF